MGQASTLATLRDGARARPVRSGLSTLAVLALSGAMVALAALPSQAQSGAISVRVTPAHDLMNGQTVTVSGHGLGKPPPKGAPSWFVTECTAKVHGHMKPASDTAHCDITRARPLHLSHTGTFSIHYRVTVGIVGDGYCGIPDHTRCVISVATAEGRGTVVSITFKVADSA